MDMLEWSWKQQSKAEERIKRFGKGKYGRVLKLAKKPTAEEFKKTLQITSIGTVAIGALGFFIYLIWNNAPGFLRGVLGL